MAMRWRWPPENSWGYFCANRGASPTILMSSSTRPWTSAAPQIRWAISGSASIAWTVILGLSEA